MASYNISYSVKHKVKPCYVLPCFIYIVSHVLKDILNNLDPLRTGDLDDDDLMLDVDLPEDGFHGQHTKSHQNTHTT